MEKRFSALYAASFYRSRAGDVHCINDDELLLFKKIHTTIICFILVHFGIIGLIIFVAALASIFKQMIRLAKSTNELLIKRMSLCYLAGFCGYAFAMLTVNIAQPKYLFWAYTAVMLRLSSIDRSKTNQDGHIA